MDVIVVNEKDEVVGTMSKDEAHANGTPHRIAVVYVEDTQGNILVQSRTDRYLDHSAAGHVDPGESYKEAARRELFEELGITNADLAYVGHNSTHNERYPGRVVSHVFDIFSCVAEPAELQADEVHDVYWANPNDVLKDMKENPDTYCGGFIESLRIYIAYKK